MMSYVFDDFAYEFTEEAKDNAARIVRHHFKERDNYESDDQFYKDLTVKLVENLFLVNVRYTERIIMKMLKEVFDLDVDIDKLKHL